MSAELQEKEEEEKKFILKIKTKCSFEHTLLKPAYVLMSIWIVFALLVSQNETLCADFGYMFVLIFRHLCS